MSARRRRGVTGWVRSLRTWHQVGIFLAAAAGLGSVAVATVGSFERQYGIGATHFGFARTVEVADSFQDLKAWQLFADIRRLKRSLYDLGTPATDRDRDRFEDLKDQLAKTEAEYARITKKREHP